MEKHNVDRRKQNCFIWWYLFHLDACESKSQYTQKTDKHGGAKLMVWGSSSDNGLDV